MIPSTTLGVVFALAALGPGYVYLRVAEQRSARPARSGLLDAVELAVIGAFASTVALLVVLAVADCLLVLNIHALSRGPKTYLENHPLRLLWIVAVVLVAAYGIAYLAARVSHFRQARSIRPAGTGWAQAFIWSRPHASDVIVVTVELRDGRKITGPLIGHTIEAEDNRELCLAAPLRVQPGPAAQTTTLDDRFMLLREADIVAISGRYVAGVDPPPKARWWERRSSSAAMRNGAT